MGVPTQKYKKDHYLVGYSGIDKCPICLHFKEDRLKKEKILHLIDESIEKWRGVVFHNKIDHGIDDCPLCKKYHPINTHGLYIAEVYDRAPCLDCPIELYTGKSGCENTPYGFLCSSEMLSSSDGTYVIDSVPSESGFKKYSDYDQYQNYKKYIAAANHMLSFLYELRYWYITKQLN